MDVLVGSKMYPRVVKLEMWLHHGSLKVIEFMMELHYRSFERSEALPLRLPYMYELVNN